MKAKLETFNGIDYLSFTPRGMPMVTMLPVIKKGSRDLNNAWTWNGSLESPTLKPSVKTTYTNTKGEKVVIHYWLTDGVCKVLSDSTDGNSGKYIHLTEVKP